MRRHIFTEETYARIAREVSAGKRSADIARGLGCTAGTLRVKCSIAGVSLRRTPCARKPKPAPPIVVPMSIELPGAVARALDKQAAVMGTSGDKLAGRLLETITVDNLFAAVLDQ